MKQGEKSIIGLWKFHPNATFEKGDFVVKGENIYKVNKEIQGLDPDESLGDGAYELYPGNRVDTKEEFESIVNNSESTTDQYVSSSALNSILKGVYFGLDSDGIISSSIDVTPENTIATSSDISLSGSDDVLDSLLDAPGYNNGSIKVSKNIPSIKDLVGHPDENDVISRGDKSWLVCDREKCKKCWECVRVCNRIKKTIKNELVINNGEITDDTLAPIPTTDTKELENAANICPYQALSFTNSVDEAKEESQAYSESSNGSTNVPGRDIIVFGAKTEIVVTTTSTSGYQWVCKSTTNTTRQLYGIEIPARFFTTSGNYDTNINSYVDSKLSSAGVTGYSWFAYAGTYLPVNSSSSETEVGRGTTNGVQYKRTKTVSETYNQEDINPRAICVFEASSTSSVSGLYTVLGEIQAEIQYAYGDTVNGHPTSFPWKTFISGGSSPADILQYIRIIYGTYKETYKRYEYEQVETTTETTKTVSMSPKICAILDCLDLAAQTIGGSDYDSCRIVQSDITSQEADSNEHNWSAARTKRFPTRWTTTLHPDSSKQNLSGYPIYTFWDYWAGAPDHSQQAQFYSQGWGGAHSAAFYNLTGNIFCVKIPEECVKYFHWPNPTPTELSAVGRRIMDILGSVFDSSERNKFMAGITSGRFTSLDSLIEYLSEYSYCDNVFNVTFGRYFDNSYISGSAEYIAAVEDKITHHPYYKKEAAESATPDIDPPVGDNTTIFTTLEEWKIYEGAETGGSGDGIHIEKPLPTDGPSLAILPRVLYSEWTNLITELSQDSGNTNLLLVPRWMSEKNYTLISNMGTYGTQAYTIDRTPNWDTKNSREDAVAISNIDNNIKFISNYFEKNFFLSTADSYAILKQYSYYGNSGDNLLRVQELIDPDYGEMYVRSTKDRDWKPCILNDRNVIRKMTRLYSALDSYRQGRNQCNLTVNSNYGTSSLSTWTKDTGWTLSESINDRHYYVRENTASSVFILLVKDPLGKLHNITIYTDRRGIDTVYSITPEVTISVKYSDTLNRVFVICSYGSDIEDIYYGK